MTEHYNIVLSADVTKQDEIFAAIVKYCISRETYGEIFVKNYLDIFREKVPWNFIRGTEELKDGIFFNDFRKNEILQNLAT